MRWELKENPRSGCELRGFGRIIEEVINYYTYSIIAQVQANAQTSPSISVDGDSGIL